MTKTPRLSFRKILTLAALSTIAGSFSLPRAEAATGIPLTETQEQHDERMAWFRDARFGMFIHWGLYSQLAGEWNGKEVMGGAEWIQKYLEIPTSQYSPLAKTWKPTKYDPLAWVQMAKAAGVKYICMTTKHHDGFCLWPTKQNDDWNVMDSTEFKMDLIKPLAEACKAEGIRFCIYHSVLDWRHPDWPLRLGFNDYAKGKPNKARYKKNYLYPQLKELFTEYGDIGMIWLDGTWDEGWDSEDGKELEAYIRTLQPKVVINNRSGHKPPQPKLDFEITNSYSYIFAGDYISPEGEIPPTGIPGIDWETCQTMQLPNNWGYSRLVGFRPTRELLQTLVDVVSKGGNLLLNVGPTAEGEFPPQVVERLRFFSDWMKVNGDSIHGTTATPFETLPFNGRCTQKPGKLFFHFFEWPKSGEVTIPMRNKAVRAWAMADPSKALSTTSGPEGLTIKLPANRPDPINSVVVVEIDQAPQVIALNVVSKGKPVEVSSQWSGRSELSKEHITDGNFSTMWASEEAERSAWVEINLGSVTEVQGAILSDAPYGRTQAFELQAKVNQSWQTIASGKEIGPKRQLDFKPVKANAFRLNILQASDTPTLAEFQLLGEQ